MYPQILLRRLKNWSFYFGQEIVLLQRKLMRTSILSPFIIAAVFLCGTAPRADATQLTVTSTASFPTTYTAFTDSLTSQNVFFPSQAIATINPFNAALGTLDKVSIHWDFGGSFTGTAGSNSGSAAFSIAGSAYVNATSYSGGGGGGSNNAGSGVTFSASQSKSTIYQNFLPAGAGVNYDPAILAAFTGPNPYTVTFEDLNRYFYYTSVASGTATSYRDVAVTYTYTAAPSAVPEIDPATGSCALALVVGLAAILDQRRRVSLVA